MPAWLLLLLALSLAACDDDAPPQRAAAPVIRPETKPPPSPVPASPRRRSLDERGELREAADRLYGFQLPVGAYPIRESRFGTTLGVETQIRRLVRFYASRGYDVSRGRGGYTITHSAKTAEDVGNPEKLRRVKLFLHEGERGMRELRFVLSPRKEP